jgi:butyryl-CoA dehydrogenase
MFLALDEQQLVLKDAVERMVADRASLRSDELPAAAEAFWQDLTEADWLSLGLPEEVGGVGGGLPEICLVVEAAAYGALVTPHMSAMVMGARLLAHAAPEIAQSKLPDVFSGTVRLALAHSEGGEVNPDAPTTRATRGQGGWRLSGRKVMCFGAPAATQLLVSASTDEGVALFLLDSSQPGIAIESYQTQRGERAADIVLDCEAPAESLLAIGPAAGQAVGRAFDEGLTVLCWEAVGEMRALVDLTAEHLKVREQFGAPLAKLQVLRHRLAEMKVAYEDAKASASLAMLKASDAEGGRFASAAKAHLAKAAQYVASQAVQLHGGMGVTEEALVSTHFRRLTAFEQLLGSRDYHLRRYADRTGPARLHWKSAVLP